MVKKRLVNFWAAPIRFKASLLIGCSLLSILVIFGWNQYKVAHPRAGSIIKKPNMGSASRTRFPKSFKEKSSVSFSCQLPPGAKVDLRNRLISSKSGAIVIFLFSAVPPSEKSNQISLINTIKTSSGFDDERVYAGSWVGDWSSEHNLNALKKPMGIQSCSLYKPDYRLIVNSIWPKGNAKAKEEAQEIMEFVVYSIREEK